MSRSTSQRGGASKILVPVLAVLAMLLGVWGGQHWLGDGVPTRTAPEDFPGTLLPQGRALPEFALQDDQGQAFVPASLQGKWTLLFFGYTHCPDVCPTTLGTLKRVWDGLAKTAGGVDDVAVVFVSVDPARDSLDHLAEYVDYFEPAFTGVTGDDANLQRLSRSLGAIYVRARGGSDENYLVDHTAAIFLLDPQGHYTAVLSAPHDADRIVAGIDALRD